MATIIPSPDDSPTGARKAKPDVQIQAIIQVAIKDALDATHVWIDDHTAMKMAQDAMIMYNARRPE